MYITATSEAEILEHDVEDLKWLLLKWMVCFKELLRVALASGKAIFSVLKEDQPRTQKQVVLHSNPDSRWSCWSQTVFCGCVWTKAFFCCFSNTLELAAAWEMAVRDIAGFCKVGAPSHQPWDQCSCWQNDWCCGLSRSWVASDPFVCDTHRGIPSHYYSLRFSGKFLRFQAHKGVTLQFQPRRQIIFKLLCLPSPQMHLLSPK